MLSFVFLMVFAVSLDAKASWYEKYRQFYEDIVPNNATLLELFKQHLKDYENMTGGKQKRADYSIPLFVCPALTSDTEPTSDLSITEEDLMSEMRIWCTKFVHSLGPQHIDVIAAMGDSLTAGQGLRAGNILDFTEYRGESWSIGGNADYYRYLTLPNIIKLYNPNVYGYSTGSGSYTSSSAQLNVANPGDEAVNMPYQATLLVDRINKDPNIDAANDWKLVTLFIGGNDLCGFCSDRNFYSEINYIDYIEHALDILHSGLTKTFVNLVMIFDIAPIANINGGFFCGLAHGFACSCGKDSSLKTELLDLTRKYQFETELLVRSGKYDTRDDFTVVVQPFFRDTVPPASPNDPNKVDMSYFAPDCFHFSEKGHMAAALSLWNNMVEGVCDKEIVWHLDGPLNCLGTVGNFNKTVFATYKNSQTNAYSMCT